MKKLCLCLLSIFIAAGTARAAPDGELEFFNFERASLEDILNLKTSVASRLESPARQAPGIITLITREEIINSGARNIIDVLRLVPGLDFGVDVESSLGIGVRGNWGLEGKVLVLVDGQTYNEPFFGTAQLARIPVEQIERIEVVRGPGSAVYGGYAELGVIKITTRGARSINGTETALSYGYMARTYGGRTADLAYGRTFDGGELSAKARIADFNQSDRRYTDFSGGSYSMADASQIHSRNFNLGLTSGHANLRLIADQYRTTEQDFYAESILPRPFDRNYDAYFAEVNREFALGEKLTLTPSFNYSYMAPFCGFDPVYYPRDKSSHYSKGTLLASYTASGSLRFSAGTEISELTGILADTTPMLWHGINLYFLNGKKTIRYHNEAFFGEAVAEYPFGVLSIGARYDKAEEFNSPFSPRLAWTKVFERLNLKAIYSNSFRAPGIDNLSLNPALQPEKTTVTEFEAGYKFTDAFFLSANVFDIRINQPIVYYTGMAVENYGNYGHTGTKGFEITTRLKKTWGYSDLSYSYYTASDSGVTYFSAGSGSLLAFAPHKFTLNSSVKISPDFSVNPSAVYYTGRRGYYAAGLKKRFDDILLADLNFSLKNLLKDRLELSLGVFDIFNSGYSYIQPYDGGHAPLPGPSREIRTRLSYKF